MLPSVVAVGVFNFDRGSASTSTAVAVAELILESLAWTIAGLTLMCDQRCGKMPCFRLCGWIAVMCIAYAVDVGFATVAENERLGQNGIVVFEDDVSNGHIAHKSPWSDFSELDLVVACIQFALTTLLAVLLLSVRACTYSTQETVQMTLCEPSCLPPSIFSNSGGKKGWDCFAHSDSSYAWASSSSPNGKQPRGSNAMSAAAAPRDWLDRMLFVTPRYQSLLHTSTAYGYEIEPDLSSSILVVIDKNENKSSSSFPGVECGKKQQPSSTFSSLFSGLLKIGGGDDGVGTEEEEAAQWQHRKQLDFSAQNLDTWPSELEVYLISCWPLRRENEEMRFLPYISTLLFHKIPLP